MAARFQISAIGSAFFQIDTSSRSPVKVRSQEPTYAPSVVLPLGVPYSGGLVPGVPWSTSLPSMKRRETLPSQVPAALCQRPSQTVVGA